MWYFLVLLIGITFGSVVTYFTISKKLKPSGTFVIDVSDPMKDICRFEMDESLDSIYSKKYIVLKVESYAEFSPK